MKGYESLGRLIRGIIRAKPCPMVVHFSTAMNVAFGGESTMTPSVNDAAVRPASLLSKNRFRDHY